MQAPLPTLMVAPTGARRTRKDHPQLPIHIDEIVSTAKSCASAGADGIHIHVRDKNGFHILDVGLYNEVLKELELATPTLTLQVTTEAVGRYTPKEQRQLVKTLKPASVSISTSEMLADEEFDVAVEFYQWCRDEDIAVQHILYSTEDLMLFETLLNSPVLELNNPQLLYVLGRHSHNQQSSPQQLDPFMQWLTATRLESDWAVCAFGQGETDCLVAAHALGGKMRVGFENSLWNKDGTIARDNAERVAEIRLSTRC
ncbi:MAG: 3-keto-5-aminohexanoate cleavage protein [Granulosicoccus sp.]